MAVVAGISVLELREGFSEGIASDGPVATKAYLVPNWFDRFTVANALMGLTTYGGGTVGFMQPNRYPESSNMTSMSLSIRGAGTYTPGAKQGQFTSAVITVTYGVRPYGTLPSDDPNGANNFDPAAPLIYATQAIKRGAQFITIPRSKLKTAGGNTLDQDVGRLVGVNTLSLTLHYLPFLVGASVRSLIGKMNSAPIFGCATGTLLLMGIDTNRTFSTDGNIMQDTTYTLMERPEATWDSIYTGVGASGWEKVVSIATGASILQSNNFSTLVPSAYQV